ncbi:Telomerase reverse transcriptase, putative isoform 2 [Hibiscus syriacus]|uniref:Telomerase reverse transcriptase n=1 Tax=Hibiscus syriacus TaxID=106335 RepID=A0A6A2XY56_HIBSY|nr:Telomerase reverse transcriptase, putative isoform 2 [Hibiscus syriacus]
MARRKKNRHGKAPIVLRNIYRDNARSLATTITSIIHRPLVPLLAPVVKAVLVFDAVKTPWLFFYDLMTSVFSMIALLLLMMMLLTLTFIPINVGIKKRAIEMSCQRSRSPNVICSGLLVITSCRVLCPMFICFIISHQLNLSSMKVHKKSSQIVECLTSSAWDILHEGVGDECMFYLLWHTSIFVPISGKKHLQVVGSPVKYTRNKSSKKVNIPQSGLVSNLREIFDVKYVHGHFEERKGNGLLVANFFPMEKFKEVQFRLQKCTKHFQDQTTIQCSCYLMLKAPHKASNSIEINKQYMFYNFEDSSSVLPRERKIPPPPVLGKYKQSISVMRTMLNVFLLDLLVCITHLKLLKLFIRRNFVEYMQFSCYDYNDVYKKLRPFITSLKNVSTTMPGVYIVAADVSKAFDSVDQDKLLRMIEEVMSPMLVDETVDPGLTNLLSSVSRRSLFGVLVDQGFCSKILKQQLFFDLRQLLKCNVVQLDTKFYLQKLGIPQGSIISTHLCSLYYGHMDKHVIFPYLERVMEALSSRLMPFDSSDAAIFPPAYLLLRFVDDFLFISTSKELASDFLSMLRRGFPDYNCYMNEEKFCLNFAIEHHSGILSNRLFTGEDGISFIPWSGLLINSKTLEVQGDYTRCAAV